MDYDEGIYQRLSQRLNYSAAHPQPGVALPAAAASITAHRISTAALTW